MLKALRHPGIKKNIFIVLTVVVILGFLVSMVVVSHDNTKASSSLGVLNGHTITVQQYLDSYRAVTRQAEWMYGSRLNEMRRFINFKGEAWDRLLLLDHAKKEKIHASDGEVVNWITTQQAFRSHGQFDQKYYEMFVQRGLRSTARAFEEEIRQMLTIQKLNGKTLGEVAPTDQEVLKTYEQEKTEKGLLYGVLASDKFKDKGDQAEAEMNKKAREIREKLKTGDFQTILKEEGLETGAEEKYKKGVYPAGVFPSDNLEKAVADLKAGDITDFFTVPKGMMVAKITGVAAFDEKKFEDEKQKFKEELASKKSNKAMNELLESLRKNLQMNLPLMKEIFPSEPEEEKPVTSASTEGPSTPS